MIHTKTNIRARGYYRIKIMRDDVCRHDTGWFENLITNQGMDWIGANPPNYNTTAGGQYLNTHCGVGTGTTPPSYTDTRLTAFLAMYPSTTSTNVEGGTLTYVAGPPPYWSCVWTYSFATGAVVGTLTEVGVGNTASADTSPQLFSHALILDGSGNPTTLPVTSADALQVTYELRYYIDTTDNSYSMNVSGTTYSGTYRRAEITTVPEIYFSVFGSAGSGATGKVYSYAYQGFALGPTTGDPTYTAQDGGGHFSYTNTAYVPGTYYCEFTTSIGLSYANFPSYISGFMTSCNHGNYQFSISPVIPKTSSYTLSIVWHVSWSRY